MLTHSPLTPHLAFTDAQLSSIFTKVLHLPDARHSEFEMSYPEFLESLGAIAVYKIPDPYMPMQIKLETFLSTHLIPTLKKIIRRRNA
jgi:hypothetical protein